VHSRTLKVSREVETSSHHSREEFTTTVFDSGNYQRTIQEGIVLLAGGFCDQQAAMTSTAEQWLLVELAWLVIGTYRVVGA
jgi:hypothetical protein